MSEHVQNYYQSIIPRLNGDNIKQEFSSHLTLVKRGIAGFIVFGGRLKEVRQHIRQLQEDSELPLIIASDLERGLGQQLKGGTLFPPAMALAKAMAEKTAGLGQQASGSRQIGRDKLKMLRQSFKALAEEARYAGINTILAPVLDINTNPDNPIIGVRSFGEDSGTVSYFGEEMILALQKNGIAACGKHFPGHGNTAVDSHISLPSIPRSLASLLRSELRPFRKAVAAEVAMLMLGHLDVPALDSSGTPVSLSRKVVAYIRNTLHYKGLLITDAMNMGGLSGFTEEEASYRALRAGVDIILHPLHAERVAAYLKQKKYPPHNLRLTEFRRGLLRFPDRKLPRFEEHLELSRSLTARAMSLPKDFLVRPSPVLIILTDEKEKQGKHFIKALRERLPNLACIELQPQRQSLQSIAAMTSEGKTVITAVFSETRAWKGLTGDWLRESVEAVKPVTSLFVAFGNPYLIRNIPAGKKLLAYWNSELSQQAAAEAILSRYTV
ncbi:MAG: hypothetical protein C0402_13050 [Thermodesulfovibrio sp.]|nr:hypothetical protein [Thermodesulfovibrio sp.]